MENQRYEHNYHDHNHNYTIINSESFINLPLLITILISFSCIFLFILLMFFIIYFCKNYSKICSKICKNSPCKRKERKKGIEIELGSLSHEIIYQK
jgi:hypothetical protein